MYEDELASHTNHALTTEGYPNLICLIWAIPLEDQVLQEYSFTYTLSSIFFTPHA